MNLVFGNTAVLVGALVGPLIARGIGTPAAFILFGGLRLAVSLLIFKRG
jgi:hypothetical protein